LEGIHRAKIRKIRLASLEISEIVFSEKEFQNQMNHQKGRKSPANVKNSSKTQQNRPEFDPFSSNPDMAIEQSLKSQSGK
jgi:hypothetical protein